MKRVAILGSTGSIGTQSLDVIEQNSERFQVIAMTCGRNLDLFREQIRKFSPEVISCEREEDALILAGEFPEISVSYGEAGLVDAAGLGADIVLNALMGMRGMMPTYEAIKAGSDIALANKETLVAGGGPIMRAAGEKGVRMLPVDSEHSAIFQCLQGNRDKETKKILLTASGGPFRGWSTEELAKVTPEMALKHPNWTMGAKITIDSATMMNKGLEIIEAKWLFGVDTDDIKVLVHPQSVIHSAVEFSDTSVLAQLGVPDMRIPISIALAYPDRLRFDDTELDFFGAASSLTFEAADENTFRCLGLAKEASRKGGTLPCVMNAANEVLVQAFLDKKIGFTDIPRVVEKLMETHENVADPTIEDIVEIDRETRQRTEETLRC